MREILFRGKRVDNGEWIEGYYYEELDGTHNIMTKESTGEYDGVQYYVPVEVIPETVGQYTGLDDKNGRKIFEWDVCKISIYGPEYIGFVDFYSGCFALDISKTYGTEYAPCMYEFFEYEVIGNIHDKGFTAF